MRWWWGFLMCLPGVILAGQALAGEARVAPVRATVMPEAIDAGAPPAAVPADDDWSAYGRSNAATRYAPQAQIKPDNIAALTETWRYRLGKVPAALSDRWAPRTTPLKVDDTLFLCTGTGDVLALQASTGALRWRHEAAVPLSAVTGEASCRGVAFHESLGADAEGLCRQRVLTGTPDGRLLALDADTGQACREFGHEGSLALPVAAPPTLVRGVAVVASGGAIIGLSAATGRELWRWPEEGSVATQAVFSSDEELGLVYVPLRQPATLVALDVTMGEPAWTFTAVQDDAWGYGLVAQASLVDWPVAGTASVPALILPTPHGELFVLDRESGEPLLPVTAQPIPAGYGPEGALPVTQPGSALPGPRGRVVREEDAWGASLISQLWCRIQFRRLGYQGDFTPPGERPWLQSVGDQGGIGWGGVSVDADRRLLVLNYSALPARGELRDGAPSREPWGGAAVPCTRPPHGGLMALDLKTGTVAWDQPLGQGGLPLPFGLRLPWPGDTGTPNQGGVLLTAGGLAFVAATTDNLIRALDSATGEELWRARLPAGGQATPMSYSVDGRQFIAIVAGGDYRLGTRPGDYLLVFALPD